MSYIDKILGQALHIQFGKVKEAEIDDFYKPEEEAEINKEALTLESCQTDVDHERKLSTNNPMSYDGDGESFDSVAELLIG